MLFCCDMYCVCFSFVILKITNLSEFHYQTRIAFSVFPKFRPHPYTSVWLPFFLVNNKINLKSFNQWIDVRLPFIFLIIFLGKYIFSAFHEVNCVGDKLFVHFVVSYIYLLIVICTYVFKHI